jgi:tetratricopeptide (TPR) repeat protein
MSLLAATQIPKPADEQAFERASIVLWRGLLEDPNVQRNGRRGQRQNGVDLYGIRRRDSDHHVGIQCKLKGEGHFLTEEEVRDEVRKALTFKPRLKEYFIVTTAPDDVAMQELARELTADLKKAGTPMPVYVWGWNTLEELIAEDAAARQAFDPTFGPHSAEILAETRKISLVQSEIRSELGGSLRQLTALVEERLPLLPGDATSTGSAVEAHLDAEINSYRKLSESGKPETAMGLFQGLLGRVEDAASGRIMFRIKANLGACLYALGRDDEAASILSEAYDHAPEEPKAAANKAFSLLLKGQWQELLEFGARELTADPTNEGLAGFLVQTSRFDDRLRDPLDLVPEPLREALPVRLGRIDFFRSRRSDGEWRKLAHEAKSAFPDDPHAIQFAAEASIDEVLSDETYRQTGRLLASDRERLSESANDLIALWDKARAGETAIRPEIAAINCNIVVALLALDEVERALVVARQGLAAAPDDESVLTRAAMAASEGGDYGLAADLLSRLPDGPEAAIVAFRLYVSRKNWTELAKLLPKAELLPDTERLVVATACRIAWVISGTATDKSQLLKGVARDAAGNSRASIIVADLAREEGYEDISLRAFETARDLIGPESHLADRMMVAQHAGRRDRWAEVADLLFGHVANDRDSDELRMLARALVNDTPVRKRALRFFDGLPGTIRELAFFRHGEGVLRFNHGDLAAAETVLKKAIDVDPVLDNYLVLISVLRRGQRQDEIKSVLGSIDLDAVEGSSVQKMHLAQLLREAGEGAKALDFAYNVLLEARNEPKVALAYFGLIMMFPDDDLIPPSDVVAVDTYVHLKGDAGRDDGFLIVAEGNRPADGIVSPDHPTAAAAMGLTVGAEFEVSAAFGETRRWRVAEIKHKYLHALHDVMENFEKRFPDAGGFYSVQMVDGDVEPALDQVRKTSEAHRDFADLYLVRKIPLSLVAQRQSGDSIGLAEYIRSLDEDIRTCVGLEGERLAARAVITAHRASGAVLDAYTAWTVATMNAFDDLKTVFGTVTVPRTVIDELHALADSHKDTGRPTMTVTWRDGQFYRQEHSPEDVAARRAFIFDQIAKIEMAGDVVPATAPDEPTKLARTITDVFGSHVLDPAFLAAENRVLVSEDMYYRQWANAATDANGVWLQTVFSYAAERGWIDRYRYADLLVQLAWRRHGHLSLNPQAMLDIFLSDTARDMPDFAAVAQFIGSKQADIESHVSVSKAFLDHIWSARDDTDVKAMQATSVLFANLVRYIGKSWARLLALIWHSAKTDLRDYIERWVQGHFLSTEQFQAERDEIRARRMARRYRLVKARRDPEPNLEPYYRRVGGKRGKPRQRRRRKR